MNRAQIIHNWKVATAKGDLGMAAEFEKQLGSAAPQIVDGQVVTPVKKKRGRPPKKKLL